MNELKHRHRRQVLHRHRSIRHLLGIIGATALVFGSQIPLSAQQTQTAHVSVNQQPKTKTQLKPGITTQADQQLVQLARQHGLAQMHPNALQVRVIKAEVMASADRLGVPRALALAVSGHESGGWKMWEQKVIRNTNQTESGGIHSTDWGVMQINDLAHPQAFPRASKDLAYNIKYGLNYLAELHKVYQGSLNQGFGDWDVTLAAYNLGHAPSPDEMQTASRYLSRLQSFLKQERLPFMLQYTVQPGDTLASIAEQKLGRASRWLQIWQANDAILPSPSSLRVGQVIKLPLV